MYKANQVFSAIFNDPEHVDQRFPVPVLQCLQIKPLAPQQGPVGQQPERYRVVLSDIRNYVQCMLATRTYHGLFPKVAARRYLQYF